MIIPILKWVFITSIFDFILRSDGECSGGVSRCQWTPWEAWNSCSRTCGGGTQQRIRYFCCESSLASNIDACMADCGMNYDDYRQYFSDHRNCNQYCFNGGSFVSGTCRCPDSFYGTCCSQECPYISNCERRYCYSSSRRETYCSECYQHNVLYKQTDGNRYCERMCAWDNYNCWPGYCSGELLSGCSCASGFRKVSTSSETSCQPTQRPSIQTCDAVFVGPYSEKRRSESTGGSSACDYRKDVYGNYRPSTLQYTMMSEYTVYVSSNKPAFIYDYHFGVTDMAVNIVQQDVSGYTQRRETNNIFSSSGQQTAHRSGSIYLGSASSYLYNGQALCAEYEARGGGYLRSKNLITHSVSSEVPYQKVTTTKQICYRYDNMPPVHCQATSTCSQEPIQLAYRITRSTLHRVTYTGWTDPIPPGGSAKHASSIESYQITVNEVMPSNGPLKVDLKNVFTKKVGVYETSMILNLTADTPRLFCITLEVKDVADNIRQTRRFLLFDNTSSISTWSENPFIVSSASSATNYTWQTHHHDICLDWKDHFYNRFYMDNELLNPIEPAPHGHISGVYEQLSGDLPVSGTPNIYGITKFMLSWKLNDGSFSSEIEVPGLKNQSYCRNMNVKDGQTYTFQVRCLDIIKNTLREERLVHIDRSVPEINNIWLTKDGYKTLYVHHMTDLSTMQLHFETFDPHSGIRTIMWTFGETDSGQELASGVLAVGTIIQDSCPHKIERCYCPDVGACEIFNYTVPLNKLVADNKHMGDHNRNYYFTIKVTNNAMLFSTERLDILVDDSPPEPGVVYEGPENVPDIDYTSDDRFVVHWHGFIDHESGMKVYRIGVADRCLGQNELYNFSSIADVEHYAEVLFTETSTSVRANFTGKRFVTIIAINNAMDPSKAVCSDGITRDITPPELRNLSLWNAKWSPSVVCHDGLPWLFESSLAKISMQNVTACTNTCRSSIKTNPLASALPTIPEITWKAEVSQLICHNKQQNNEDMVIYLPNDYIYLKWDVEELGSQINDFYVGIGRDPTEHASPGFDDYKSTVRKTFFKRRHEGVGSNEFFYIFIKAVNKAGLHKVTILGPVLIDETPPLAKHKPAVEIIDQNVVVGWEMDTFYDMEQREQINTINIQIGHDGTLVTPLIQWKLEKAEPCPVYSGGCFTYPVRRLQTQDTGLGLDFFIDMHIYNNAGHSLKVTSEKFKIPSLYPPGHAVVTDLDPEVINPDTDINMHFTNNTICVSWTGFRHHESLVLQVGVGSRNTTDDVVPFRPVDATTRFCIEDTRITFNTMHFALIMASCSGGMTVSSSNGVLILNEEETVQSLSIRVGKDCRHVKGIAMEIATDTENETISFNYKFQVGKRYTMLTSNVRNIRTKDGFLRDIANDTNMDYMFISFVENPAFRIQRDLDMPVRVNIQPCVRAQPKVIKSVDRLLSFWFKSPSTEKFSAHMVFEVSLARSLQSSYEYIQPFRKLNGTETNFTFQNLILKSQDTYQVAIKQCSKLRCVKPVFSDTFWVDDITPYGRILTSDLKLNIQDKCFDINIKWEAFQTGSDLLFYQWTVSKDNRASNILTFWHTYTPKDNKFQVTRCVTLPVHGKTTLFGCVRAFTESGQQGTTCSLIHTTQGEYKRDTVYEFDAKSPAWKSIRRMLSSSNIGKMYRTLHDNELDFGKSSTPIAGAILYASERIFTWYLMTSREVPSHCDFDTNCWVQKSTDTGYVIFDKEIKLNKPFYICAYSNGTLIEREWFTETFEEISSCSNGFVLDNVQPVPGDVHVANTSGFITSTRNIQLTWDAFDDNINSSIFGYVDGIKGYSFALGLRPGSEDVHHFTDVGLSTTTVINRINVSDGMVVFCTVRGTDLAGNVAEAVTAALVVDTTPPLTGSIFVLNQNMYAETSYFITSDAITIYLSDFVDPESGVSHYEIGLGTQPYITDVVPLFTCAENMVDISMTNLTDESQLRDGHVYYVLTRAVNHASLTSSFSSLKMTVDRSPPVGGHVMDGHWSNKDVDFQTDTYKIHGHWKGFSDEHSGMSYYSVGLGTEPYQDDVEPMVDVGLTEDIEWHGVFILGQTYYITVEACNVAGLCETRVSDGVTIDNSPPIQGIVQTGSDNIHQKYQSQTSSIHVRWSGFEDPQSGIDHYEVCLGSTPGSCSILPYSNSFLQTNVILTGLSLPTYVDLYVTVTAQNKVGMNVSQTSDSFRVDKTPPVLHQKPRFSVENNDLQTIRGHWDKSLFSLSWKFIDLESPVSRHEITLVTHHEGHTPVEHVRLGSENTITVNLDGKNWLHDGDTYFAIVTSCNAADLCSSEKSDDLLIDSTPPHVGGFKPPMLWNNFNNSLGSLRANISLSWYGFHDQESDIAKYYITVSRSYSGSELTDGVVTVLTNNTSDVVSSFFLSETLRPDDLIFLSIWAENGVGLNSSVARVSVFVLCESKTNDVEIIEGSLELQKHSCDIHFCNKDCTCAVLGKPCAHIETYLTCKELSALNTSKGEFVLPNITVYTGFTNPAQTITASSACLVGHWIDNSHNETSGSVARYEWSMGINDEPVGQGIFDWKNEMPWHDIGLRTKIVYCLPVNRSLSHGEQYVIYLRAWFSAESYATYRSNPINVDQTPPALRRGKFVTDSDENCAKDFDIIDWMDTITGCWKGLFSEHQGIITHYTVSMGVALHAYDVLPVTNVELATNITLRNLTLTHGTKYFFTVTAYNSVGLHTTAISDGFVVAMETPVAGIVFNTARYRNKAFHSRIDSLGFSWNGFQDAFSGIRNFYISLYDASTRTYISGGFKNVGMQTRFTFSNLSLEHAMTYYGVVKAEDNLRHASKEVSSEHVVVDLTPPRGLTCVNFTEVSFVEGHLNDSGIHSLVITTSIYENTLYKIWGHLNKSSEIPTIKNIVLHLNRFHKRLPTIARHDGVEEFQHIFLSQTNNSVNFSVSVENVNNETAYIAISECITTVQDDKSAVSVRQISKTMFEASIHVVDDESSLYKVEMGAGTTRGGFQIKPLTRIHHELSQGFIFADLLHGTPVYITVVAENRAGLKSVFYSEPIIVDRSAPLLTDLSARTHTVHVNVSGNHEALTVVDGSWKVSDDESGTKYCFCSLAHVYASGHEARSSDVQSAWLTQSETSCTSDQVLLHHGDMIYINVKCVNNVEMSVELSSTPLMISIHEPRTQSASVSFVPLNDVCSMYTSPDDLSIVVQSRISDVQFRWDGFVDPSGIDHFEFRLMEGNVVVYDWTNTGLEQMVVLRGQYFEHGNITAEVRAVNSGLHTSDLVQSTILIVTDPPALTDQPLNVTRHGRKITMNWKGVFQTTAGVPLSYSVVVGTKPGVTDILDLNYTSGNVMDVDIPKSTIITPNPTDVFVQITCLYATGLATTYRTRVKIE